jgi:hypothetical protein
MPVPLRVSYERVTDGKRVAAAASDLTLGGLFIETESALPVGGLVTIELEAGSTKVTLDARVLSRRAKAEGPAKPAGMAVRFIDLPNDAAAALQMLLATHTRRQGTTLGLGEPEEGVAKYESVRNLPTGLAAKAAAAPKPIAAPAPAPAPPAAPPAPSPEDADWDIPLAESIPGIPAARPLPAPTVDAPGTPKHPTPRIMPASGTSQPPSMPLSAPVPSSAPAVSSASPSWQPAATMGPAKPKRSLGLVIAIVVVLALLVLGGAAVALYFVMLPS